MLPKFVYGIIFMFVTTLHICSHLIPVVEANAHIRTAESEITRKLFMNVGYKYHHSMLFQSLINSTLLVYGAWRCEKAAAQKIKDAQRGANNKITAATEVKLNWLISKGKLPSIWKFFSMRDFFWYTVPWMFTFIGNGFLNFRNLNMIMGHFCTSPMDVMSLYARIQLLYLQNVFSDGLAPFFTQCNGALGALVTKNSNFISYESDILSTEKETP